MRDNFSPIPTCTCDGCSCNLTKQMLRLQKNHRIMQFLMKLDPKYNQVLTNILMMNELPNASIIYRLLQQEERHKEVSKLATTSTDSMVFAVDRRKHYHNSHEHSTQERLMSGTKRNAHYFCDHCKIPGHSIERCFKIHGYPSNSRRNFNTKVAAITQSDTHDSSIDLKETGLSREQFTHLLIIISKKDTEKPPDADHSITTTGKIADISHTNHSS
ncbi:uncharacterized protein LOC130805167 isoform X2 [Amaranthus tricolor]|uniref:uncharacterized protein LOC130805167 isoform X2 n=1 Tax=Amaranthus tricolor TaxID=29722 RepID=UPI0025912794|nr:uncharacterized protein LOC130805167 isoform X2 [Amaranthus tricolor]